MRPAYPFMLAALVVLGCAPKTETQPPAGIVDRAGSLTWLASEPEAGLRIARYTSSAWGFSTNSFVLEGPSGLVVIDTQFLPSAADELLDLLEQTSDRPVVAALVLHPNPDKFNGTARFQARGIPVLTSSSVAAAIPAVFEQRTRAFADRYAPDWPDQTPTPEHFADDLGELELAGLALHLHTLGPGCSRSHLAVEVEGELFVGDLVADGTHLWLELGQLAAWRARLAELGRLGARRVYPGRGHSRGPELLSDADTYLEVVEQAIARERARLGPNPALAARDEALAGIAAELEARWPERRLAVFIRLGLVAAWQAAPPG